MALARNLRVIPIDTPYDDAGSPSVPRNPNEVVVYTGSIDDPATDTALSGLLAERVGEGRHAPVLRVHRPGRILAFGRADRNAPGYPEAVAEARSAGFTPVERLAGGRAAVFHESTLAVSFAVPADEPKLGIRERFEAVAGGTVNALRSLGADAAIGELPGEYCPGAYSVHLDGRLKVAGFGQRLVKGAAHTGGVVVVGRSDLVRTALVPVYRALGLHWDPRTAGALDDRVAVDLDTVEAALISEFTRESSPQPADLPSELVAEARERAKRHRPGTR